MIDTRQFVHRPENSALPRGEALCAICAQGGHSCCRTDPDLTHLSFPLSDVEWQRLVPYVHLALMDQTLPSGADPIRAEEPNTPDFIASMHALFPQHRDRVTSLFPHEATHYTLRTKPAGECVFVDENGCRLPRSVRPWYCLIFPAWIIRGGLALFTAQGCVIAEKARSAAHGLTMLTMTPADARKLHAALCHDWGMTVK